MEECGATPKIPTQEANWHATCGTRARPTTVPSQQNQDPIHQINQHEDEYTTYLEQPEPTEHDQGNEEEPPA